MSARLPLGAFSTSLAVKDLGVSRAFYGALGFEVVAGVADDGWLILRSGDCTLGLFQGHIPENMLTFNPGWSSENVTLEEFEDVREIQARLKAAGAEFVNEADPRGTGPASFTVRDPDGNQVFFDQHVPAPGAGPSTTGETDA
ncbi:MAG: VOC family protein [Pseudomonadota bacterium]